MKTTEFKAIYQNGNEEFFYCLTFQEAIVTAMYYAHNKGWGDARVKYVSDGTITAKDIEIKFQFA